MKKNIRIIILNEITNFNKSFIINNYFIYIFGLLLFILIGLSSFGLFRLIKPHEIQQSVKTNINLKYNTINMLKSLVEKNKIDSSLLTNFEIKENYHNIIPKFMPVKGIVTKGIKNNHSSEHLGIDIAAKFNSNVQATQEGLVIFSGIHNNYGNTIIIAHPNNYYSLYAHLNKINVKQRDYVNIKQKIGTVGESGKSDGPHLHFEIWKNHVIIDPRELIKEYKIKDVSIE